MKPAPPVRRIRLPVIIPNNNTAEAAPRERRLAGVAAAVLALLALGITRPWVDRPFDTIDFSEFLPYLRHNDGIWGRTAGMIGYYVGEHGRLNLVSYAGLALKWTLLGASPVLWQWARVAELGAVVALVYLFLRRMAIAPLAAVLAASLFLLDRDGTEAWIRMTMGEPLGLLAALGALLFAIRGRALWAGIMLTAAVLAKETMIGLLPLVWMVGLARDAEGRFVRPTMPVKEMARWMVLSGILPLLAFGAAAVLATGTRSAGFTALYGALPVGPADLLSRFGHPWPADPAVLLLMALGLALAWRDPASRTWVGGAILAAAALSLAFAILYLPWPYQFDYYAFPFLLGPALLFAIALDRLIAAGGGWRALALAGCGIMAVTSGSRAAKRDSETIALLQVNGDVTRFIARVPNADRIVVARGRPAPQAWMGTAVMLRRYTLATGMATTLPPAADILCPEAAMLLQRGVGRTLLISYQQGCGPIGNASLRFVRHYSYPRLDLEGAGIETDSIGADIVLTRAALAPATPAP